MACFSLFFKTCIYPFKIIGQWINLLNFILIDIIFLFQVYILLNSIIKLNSS